VAADADTLALIGLLPKLSAKSRRQLRVLAESMTD
jgi:hypothetical protein